jgi:hypothetical protein
LTVEALEEAIRRVLPAVKLEPDSFRLDRGFLTRALRRGKPAAMTMDDPTTLLIFVGTTEETNSADAAERMAEEAIRALSLPSRDVCDRLVVAWCLVAGPAFAAAYSMSPTNEVGALLGASWIEPSAWSEPMMDASLSGDEALRNGLAALTALIRDRHVAPEFDVAFTRAVQVINLTLRRQGGEEQHVSVHPTTGTSDTKWASWLDRYGRSVADEWRRVGGDTLGDFRVMQPTADGPLAGMQVFLSYARPDATTLAWPVFEALCSLGATVWFDQGQALDPIWLDAGLAETIGACDAYVMCASDEFVERAGYATQEVAWAVQQHGAGARTKHFVVAARPGTVLPTVVADWPLVTLAGEERDDLAQRLTERLLASPSFTPVLPIQIKERSDIGQPPLPAQADLVGMRRRVQHVRRHAEIDQDSVSALASGKDDDHHAASVRQRMLQLGDDLDWSGTFADFDRWPNDPFIRDIRWRLAASRALAGTRWPLSGSLDDLDSVPDDVDFLVTKNLPMLDWPTVPGWGDNERRLLLRYHAGVLRSLQLLLARGLWAGLGSLSESKEDALAHEVIIRRRECHDALVAMRLQGLLSWKGEPPLWDALLECWAKVLRGISSGWRPPIPQQALFLLTGNAEDVAAVAAEAAWYAAHYGGLAIQSFDAPQSLTPTRMEVYASTAAAPRPPERGTSQILLRLGVDPNADGTAALRLAWVPSASGSRGSDQPILASRPAPTELVQALSLRSS